MEEAYEVFEAFRKETDLWEPTTSIESAHSMRRKLQSKRMRRSCKKFRIKKSNKLRNKG